MMKIKSLLQDHSRLFSLCFSYFLATISIGFRTTQSVGTDLFHPGLWAEDGNIYINDSRNLGLNAIVQPQAGYLVLIPRIIAFISNYIYIKYIPYFFHFFWLIAFFGLIYIVHSRLIYIGIKKIIVFWTIVCMSFQPQAGEVFFNLTNLQWFTGLGLLIFLIFPWQYKPHKRHYFFIFLTGLTGPFIILVTPILLLRLFLLKDFKQNKGIYLLSLICVIIQSGCLVFTRSFFLSEPQNAMNFDTLLLLLVRFFSFGNEYYVANLFSYVFWAGIPFFAVFSSVLSFIRDGQKLEIIKFTSFLLMIAAFILIIIGFLRDNNNLISPIVDRNGAAGGSRYFLIPYTLLLISAVISASFKPKGSIIVLTAFSFICYANFNRTERLNMQWEAFVRLSESVPNINIPIAPRIEAYPGWFVSTKSKGGISNKKEVVVSIPLDSVSLSNAVFTNDSTLNSTIIESTSDYPLIEVKLDNYHSTCKYIALEISGNRDFYGWIHVLWSNDGFFSDEKSQLRYHPEGKFNAYFAFKNEKNEKIIQIRPSFTNGKCRISEIKVYYLY